MKNLFSTLILSLLALGCTQQQPESLRLATFNIRYDNSGDGPNSWPHRKDSICAFIHRVDPDIIDMQEVLHHQLEVLKTAYPNIQLSESAGKMEKQPENMHRSSLNKRNIPYWTRILSGFVKNRTVSEWSVGMPL